MCLHMIMCLQREKLAHLGLLQLLLIHTHTLVFRVHPTDKVLLLNLLVDVSLASFFNVDC
jgi:hypothetical protein